MRWDEVGSTGVNGVILLCPLVVLPFALSVSYYLALRLSVVFCAYHLLVAVLKLLVPALFAHLVPISPANLTLSRFFTWHSTRLLSNLQHALSW